MCVMTTTSSPQLTLSRGRGVLASQESTTPDASALIESESAEVGTGAARMIYLLHPPRRHAPFNGTQPMIPGSRWVLTFQTPPRWHPHLPTPYRSMAKISIDTCRFYTDIVRKRYLCCASQHVFTEYLPCTNVRWLETNSMHVLNSD